MVWSAEICSRWGFGHIWNFSYWLDEPCCTWWIGYSLITSHQGVAIEVEGVKGLFSGNRLYEASAQNVTTSRALTLKEASICRSLDAASRCTRGSSSTVLHSQSQPSSKLKLCKCFWMERDSSDGTKIPSCNSLCMESWLKIRLLEYRNHLNSLVRPSVTKVSLRDAEASTDWGIYRVMFNCTVHTRYGGKSLALHTHCTQ